MVIIMILKKKKEKIYLLLYPARAAQSTFAGPTDNPQTHKTKIEKKGTQSLYPRLPSFFIFSAASFPYSCPLSSPHAYHDCSIYQRRRLSHAAKPELLTLCSHSHSQKNGIVEYQEREVKNFFELAGSQKWCAHESRHQRSYFQLHAESFGIIISSFLIYVLVLETSWSFKTNAIPRYPI